jgi:hypothetical protein
MSDFDIVTRCAGMRGEKPQRFSGDDSGVLSRFEIDGLRTKRHCAAQTAACPVV